jgi:hypothetical protein
MMRSSKRTASVLGTLVVAGLLVFVVAPASAAATPLSAAANGNSSWSYGVLLSVKVGPNTASNGWVYEGNATLGYTVTIYENSTSATTFELTIYRTMGLAYMIRFCDVACGSPVQWANETFRAYETTATFANFTDQGTVLLNGTTDVPAIALQNSTSFLHANVTESTNVYLPSAGYRGPHLGYLGANLLAKAAVSFSPALGLIPDQLFPGSTWSSSSDFNATGSASWRYYYSMERPVAPFEIGPVSGKVSLTANGSVTVQGAYPQGSAFPYGGTTYPAVLLTIVGPFDVREGIIFIPTAVDIFGSTAQPWAGNATGTATAQMASLDLKLSGGVEPRIIASSMRYSTAAANAATSTAIISGTPGVSAAASNANPVASGTIQGVPETDAQSHGTQECLTTGAGCTTSSGTSPRSLLGLIVLAGIAATAAVLVALAVVSRRRRSPPPVYPNAVLYPPGASYPAAPAGAPAAPTSPPPPEEDPLDHLW